MSLNEHFFSTYSRHHIHQSNKLIRSSSPTIHHFKKINVTPSTVIVNQRDLTAFLRTVVVRPCLYEAQ